MKSKMSSHIVTEFRQVENASSIGIQSILKTYTFYASDHKNNECGIKKEPRKSCSGSPEKCYLVKTIFNGQNHIRKML